MPLLPTKDAKDSKQSNKVNNNPITGLVRVFDWWKRHPADANQSSEKIREGSTSTAASGCSGTSLRPLSVASGASGSAGGSIRWDEKGLQTVRERTKREKDERKKASVKVDVKVEVQRDEDGIYSNDTKRNSSEGRKRMPLSGLFPELAKSEAPALQIVVQEPSIITEPEQIKQVTTPEKKPRARPQSEQLLGKPRPKVIGDEAGVLSMLDAATNDLERLISHLDLEATPGSAPRSDPRDRVFFDAFGAPSLPMKTILESPVKRHRTTPSLSSLRPYAQSRNPPPLNTGLGQQIAPWPQVDWPSSPVKPLAPPPNPRPTHKRTLTPAPEVEPMPVFTALRPRKPAKMSVVTSSADVSPLTSPADRRQPPSPIAFAASRPRVAERDRSVSPAPVFTKAPTVPAIAQKDAIPSSQPTRRPRARLDSDIPDELQLLLAAQPDSDSESAYDGIVREPSPAPRAASPPVLPMLRVPIFRSLVTDVDNNRVSTELSPSVSDDDTGKASFDFTGEINKLSQSGGSDRLSFVEQLEHAFRTPAKIDLRYGFEGLDVPVPGLPLPKSPIHESDEDASFTVDINASLHTNMSFPVDIEHLEATLLPGSDSLAPTETSAKDSVRPLKLKGSTVPVDFVQCEPTLLPGSDSLAQSEEAENEVVYTAKFSPTPVSAGSDGKLNSEFKFGGRPSPAQSVKAEALARPMTLSDALPSPAQVKAFSSPQPEGDSVLNSIYGKATELPSGNPLLVKIEPSFVEDDSVLNSIYAQAAQFSEANMLPRLRLESDSASKREARAESLKSLNGHCRATSEASFAGFDSFAEIRRGFEYSEERPAFYPPPIASRHGRQESMFSIASVSSYGQVIDPGSGDPFNFCMSSLPMRPMSEDMSMTVDDTFDFVHQASRRPRMDSNASSFYFNAPAPLQSMRPYDRSHRRQGSTMSTSSMGPPRSQFNRASHRRNDSLIRGRNDSNASASSMANSYAMHGANSGRAAWAKHQTEPSWDSIMDNTSMTRGSRPGLGDKMLQSAFPVGMPLTSISASPPESTASRKSSEKRSSYDSIMDDDKDSTSEDSLFERSGQRTSVSSDSVFGCNDSDAPQASRLLPNQFRPLSEFSMVNPLHALSPRREDETMISMVGGGDRVRRRSVGSMIDASPCARVEKRKHEVMDEVRPSVKETSPLREPMIVEKPSIASYKFGGERMLRAQQGLYSRASLEEGCLVASGEDLSMSISVQPVFSRPGPASRSRSSTCTTASSEADTPPLSAEETSSTSGDSQSSIDLSTVNISLANASFPNTARDRARARARGHGHRARGSQAQTSRLSVYETIQEERLSTAPSSPTSQFTKSTSQVELPSVVYVVDPDNISLASDSMWDDDDALRKYHALRQEAEYTVTDSRRVWLDTPFSMFACQSFVPPRQRTAMEAMLQHSLENYHSLPPELRRIRSRRLSRPSPYKTGPLRQLITDPDSSYSSTYSGALSQLSINPNIKSPDPTALTKKPVLPASLELSDPRPVKFGLSAVRPRVPSTTRRVALGWSKRSNAKNDNKENSFTQSVGTKTPNEKDTLRLSRPRPKGRPTPASVRPNRI